VYALILTWLYGAVLAKSDYFHGQTNLAWIPVMSTSLLSAFVLFAFVSSITPGPNNTMLLASG
jgi:hypothetical protein